MPNESKTPKPRKHQAMTSEALILALLPTLLGITATYWASRAAKRSEEVIEIGKAMAALQAQMEMHLRNHP